MSERERLLSAAEPAPAPGASPAGGDPGLSPAPPHHPTDSVGERRRALTRRFLRNTFACACACATLLACHTQLASVTFGGRVESADDDPSGGASSDASAQSLLAREVVVAAAGVPKSQRYSGSYPPWWNDRASLPDAQPIFIHIPKTGGVSVEDTASRAGHVTGACVVHSFGDAALPYALAPGFEMEPYHAPPARFVPYSFTIVRSPYARMVSEFNWMALSDPAKTADIKAGRWSFTCGEFQDFVERRVDGLVGSALFRCLAQSALNEADYERCVAENPSAETINDSHALPQWFLAKNAERVFKYEQFASEVWPFLKRVGVVSRGEKTLEKINSAGGASAVASECWAFVSSAVLEKFVRMYAMDFKNLGYSETDFGLAPVGERREGVGGGGGDPARVRPRGRDRALGRAEPRLGLVPRGVGGGGGGFAPRDVRDASLRGGVQIAPNLRRRDRGWRRPGGGTRRARGPRRGDAESRAEGPLGRGARGEGPARAGERRARRRGGARVRRRGATRRGAQGGGGGGRVGRAAGAHRRRRRARRARGGGREARRAGGQGKAGLGDAARRGDARGRGERAESDATRERRRRGIAGGRVVETTLRNGRGRALQARTGDRGAQRRDRKAREPDQS